MGVSLMLFFDGTNHPSGSTVKADGLDGAMLYGGTPTSPKNFTAAQYADYKAQGLFTIVGFEHVVDDWRGGAAAGKANGAALLADAKAKRVDLDDPFWVAGADQHVVAADLPTVVAYVRAYVATVRAGGWRGPSGGYGFPEVTSALHAAGVVDWYWGAGRRGDQPAFINVWQDNNNTIVVGGATDDKDWVLIPLPTLEDDEDMELTDKLDPNAAPGTVNEALNTVLGGMVNVRSAGQLAVNVANTLNATHAIQVQLTAMQGALTGEQTAILAAIASADNDVKTGAAQIIAALSSAGGIDVGQLASNLAPLLNSNEADEFMAALKSQFEK